MKKILFLFSLLIFVNSSASQDLSIVSVGKATLEKDHLFLENPYFKGWVSKSNKKIVENVIKLLRSDFSYYKNRFAVFPKKYRNHPSKKSVVEDVKYVSWQKKETDYLVKMDFSSSVSKNEGLRYVARVYSINTKKVIRELQGNLFKKDWRKEGHYLADRIFHSITGKKSIFKSRVIFVSDVTSTGRGKKRKTRKEIYVVDFDGANRQRITHHGGIVISPAISPKGDKLVYSLIKKGKGKKRIELYLLDLVTKKRTILSRRKGLNSGGTFLPSGDEILLTLSNLGNAEIYAMNLATKNLRRVTHHYASDVDPSVNGDGSVMTFLSGRSGRAHIYTLDPSGKEKSVKRISFVGRFNATPRFSPDGKEIVFSSWLDNRFDLFKINPDGTGLARLTKDFGSNESPSFSNDGEFIVFSSQRVISRYRAVQNIYLMDREGQILGAVVKDFGNCLSPRWTENFTGF
ncbi:MAG: hypothetical protein E2O68_04325 [Deltaproteobacteria bacterium]|nr:MAG: hypothetical protein E2O68_04325 [Deltaproteobacteria bacterium]